MNLKFQTHAHGAGLRMAAMLFAGGLLLAGCGKKNHPPVAPAGKTNTVAKAAGKPGATNEDVLSAESSRPKAVFEDNPKIGRDPFFPNSERRVARAAQGDAATSQTTLMQHLVLKAVFGSSPPKAWINNRSFLPGEEGVVTLPDGKKLSLKCVEIGERSATVEILGIPGQHKLTLSGIR